VSSGPEAPAESPGTAAAKSRPARPGSRMRARLRRLWERWFPLHGPSTNPGGFLGPVQREWPWLVVAGLIAVLAAIAFEIAAAIAPIPPGGDEGTWLLLSYPYVGLPAPSQTPLLSYPPASFPLLGLSVIAAGGPLAGARLFAGATIVLLGVSFYWFSRSLYRYPVVALLTEGAFFVQPDFQQLYYFGSYPNMFGLAFFFLAFAYALRFLRSRRPSHLALFWAFATVAALSHALVAVVLVAVLGILAIALLAARRLPRELFTSRAGQVGLGVFSVTSVAYYAGVHYLGYNPPNYLTAGPIAVAKSTLALPSVLKAFYLENIAAFVRGGGFTLGTNDALTILWEMVIALLIALVLLRLAARRWFTPRVVVLFAYFLAVLGLALLTWYAGLAADYRRFSYFLFPATLLVVGFGADLAFERILHPTPFHGLPSPPPPSPVPATGWRRRLPDRRTTVVIAFVALGVVGLVICADLFTYPNAQGFASFFTKTGHDPAFVAAMHAISTSGIPGSILSVTPVVDRWPSTLTGRDLYEARPPTGYTYSAANLIQDELSFLASTSRFTVTDGFEAAAIQGTNPAFFNASPTYSLYTLGVQRSVFQVAPQNIFASVGGGPSQPVYIRGGPIHPVFLTPASPANGTITIWFNASAVHVEETIAATAGSNGVTIGFVAEANGTANVTQLRVRLTSATSSFNNATALSPTSFDWFTNTTNGNFTTDSLITTPSNLTVVPAPTAAGPNGVVTIVTNATTRTGARQLDLAFRSWTIGSSNTANGVSGFYSAPQLWSSWNVRFALLWTGSNASGPIANAYLTTEYGASGFFAEGTWIILLLPTNPLPPYT
jgi:hypothetical protein